MVLKCVEQNLTLHIIIWRASNDSLLTKMKLLKRNITPNSLCVHCCCDTEDTIHAIWGSLVVKNIWWELERCRPFLAENFSCFRDLFQGILAQKIPLLAELFAYIAWSIWHNRNAQRVGTTTLPLRKIYRNAVDPFQEFQMTQDSSLLQRTVA